MPTSFSIYPSLRLSLFRMDGRITAADGKRCFISYTDHPEFDAGYAMLTDAREVTEVEASFQEILFGASSMLERIKRIAPGTPAIILVQRESVFAMARVLEQVLNFLCRIQMRVVTSPSEVHAGLGLAAGDLNLLLAGGVPQSVAARPELRVV